MRTDRERQHSRAPFEHGTDLSNRLERLHRERQAEVDRLRADLERARRPARASTVGEVGAQAAGVLRHVPQPEQR